MLAFTPNLRERFDAARSVLCPQEISVPLFLNTTEEIATPCQCVALNNTEASVPTHPLGIRPITRTSTSLASLYVFTSLTPHAGVTTSAVLFAIAKSQSRPNSRVLYIDLNISNGNDFEQLTGVISSSTATVYNLLSLTSFDEIVASLGLLTSVTSFDGVCIHTIHLGTFDFAAQCQLAQYNFSKLLERLTTQFDAVIVDLGMLQPTLMYQTHILTNSMCRPLIVADGSSQLSLSSFNSVLSELPIMYDVILNKSISSVSAVPTMKLINKDFITRLPIQQNIQYLLQCRDRSLWTSEVYLGASALSYKV